jgi:hypothetical protein
LKKIETLLSNRSGVGIVSSMDHKVEVLPKVPEEARDEGYL